MADKSREERREWTRGLWNMFLKENSAWWGTRKWIVQAILWTSVVTGSVAFVLYVFTTLPVAAKPDIYDTMGTGAAALQLFFNVCGFTYVIGVIILTHDLIISEKESGTAEWVLSKPLSRKAFVLSKLGASLMGITLIMVLLQGFLLFGVAGLFHGEIDLIPFLKGLGVIWLICLFYITFVIFLGTVVSTRGAVLGIAFLFFLAGNLIPMLYAESYYIMPWKLSKIAFSFSVSLAWSAKMMIPIVMTAVWSLLFIAGALWRIERMEI
jgi:ABC-2 type transport system permease protein